MRILIELPSWLGDAVMVSAAIRSISKSFPSSKIVFFGSALSISLYKKYPSCEKVVIDMSKNSYFRAFYLFKMAKKLGKFDMAISFRSHFFSKLLFYFVNSKKKSIFKPVDLQSHQAKKYLDFAITALNLKVIKDELFLCRSDFAFKNPALGLNPGASYGSAKRWNPKYFADIAIALKDKFDIFIFGSENEKDICADICAILDKNKVKYQNLCGKTSIDDLVSMISALDLFITNDSGPMHIAAAFKVSTIALFGPTKFKETSPYKNHNAKILHLNLECMPCMKRVCPLKTHECMEQLTPQMVLKAIDSLS